MRKKAAVPGSEPAAAALGVNAKEADPSDHLFEYGTFAQVGGPWVYSTMLISRERRSMACNLLVIETVGGSALSECRAYGGKERKEQDG